MIKNPFEKILMVTLIIYLCACQFPQLNSKQEIMRFSEEHSMEPILHVYFNRHFKSSKQFAHFQAVLNQLQDESGDYLTIAFTNCEEDVNFELRSCRQIKKTKDNRVVLGTYPSSEFITMGQLVIQSPPLTRVLEHHSDVYSLDQLKNMMNTVMPNFYKQLHNQDEYKKFLSPRYVPKLIVFMRQDEEQIPIVLKQLSVYFALKFDFALITDLNEELMSLFPEVKKFPKFIVIKYNFQTQQEERYIYTKSVLTQENYIRIKDFLQPFALPKVRNDYLFHKIPVDLQNEVTTVQSTGELEQLKERASGWILIGRTAANADIPASLLEYRKHFGIYYSYIHFRDEKFSQQKDQILSFYSPSAKQSYNIYFENYDEIEFHTLNIRDFLSNMTVWLEKDFVVVGLKKQYGYACAITQKTLFRGHTRCLIIQEGQDQQKLKEILKIDFEYGFLIRSQPVGTDDQLSGWLEDSTSEKVKGIRQKQKKGAKLASIQFSSVYYQLQFGTRMKLKQVLDEFIAQPISEPKRQVSLHEHCFHPTKKCFILLTDLSKKDRTTQDYIKELAINYIEGYQFVELDLKSNGQLVQILNIDTKKTKSDLVVFYPRTSEYVKLNKKITKGIIEKFLRANLWNDKRLKRQKLSIEPENILLIPSKNSKIQNEEL